MSNVRVLLADDHAVVRAGIRNAIEELENLLVVGEAYDGPSLMESLDTLQADMLLIDVTMPEFEPIRAINHIRNQYPALKILVISAYDDDFYVQGLLQAGVDGYHLKDRPLGDLRMAVQQILDGEKWITGSLVDKLIHYQEAQEFTPPLTSRQRDILLLLQKGHSNHAIALELNLSVKTVENHLTRLYRILGVQSRLEAVNYVRQTPQVLAFLGQEAAHSPEYKSPVAKQLSILLVDDSPRYRQQLRRMIGRIYPAARIFETEDTQSAVELARSTAPQLVFIDVVLGEQNGIYCASRIKTITTKARIILISAYPDKEFHRQSLEVGASAFIDKKILDAATLKQIIEDVAACAI